MVRCIFKMTGQSCEVQLQSPNV